MEQKFLTFYPFPPEALDKINAELAAETETETAPEHPKPEFVSERRTAFIPVKETETFSEAEKPVQTTGRARRISPPPRRETVKTDERIFRDDPDVRGERTDGKVKKNPVASFGAWLFVIAFLAGGFILTYRMSLSSAEQNSSASETVSSSGKDTSETAVPLVTSISGDASETSAASVTSIRTEEPKADVPESSDASADEDQKPAETKEPHPLMEVCPPYRTENFHEWSDLTMGGVKYDSGINIGQTSSYISSNPGYALFNLDRKYSRLTFDVGNIDKYGTSEKQGIYFYLDDHLEMSVNPKPGALPKSYEIDLSGASQMRIVASGYCGDYGMADLMITEADDANADRDPEPGKNPLFVLETGQKENYTEWLNLSVGGTLRASGISLGNTSSYLRGSEGYVYFTLNGEYSMLTFETGALDDNRHKEDQMFEIYLDDEQKWSYKLEPNDLPQTHTIDLTGVRQIKIWGSEYAGDYAIYNMNIW